MSSAVRDLARLIEVTSGFVIRQRGLDALESYAEERAVERRLPGVEGYLEDLRRHPNSEEWRRLLSRITIKESYLFRGQAQFEVLQSTVIPELVERGREHRLRVWCAGCARGEEAATLAMVLADHPVLGDWSWEILATDVDDAALAEARLGRYGRRAVARVSPEHIDRYFVERGGRYELDRELLARIRYQHLNLVDGIPQLAGGSFDLIFLRNVLIYFRTEVQRTVVEAVERTLAPSGLLFLGPSESLLHLGCSLEAHDLRTCFCYRHPGTAETPDKPQRDHRMTGGDPPDVPATAVRKPDPPPSSGESVLTVEQRLDGVIEALDSGAAATALALIGELRMGYPENAVIHGLEAIARERSGDIDAAVLGYRAALYLAPEIVEFRFLLARSLEALGRRRGAIREYREVLTGVGSAASTTPLVLRRLGLPDADVMVEVARKSLHELESESQA
jgi:chemotaxis methyl-accepting protein methylase